VLHQTLTDFEILVVNDSDEEAPVVELIDRLNDHRIHYLRNERTKGGNGARNTGILNARGQYVAFLDDDDEWFPEKLAEQVDKLDNMDSSWGGCYCGYMVLENSKWIYHMNFKERNVQKDYILSRFSIGACSTLLFKRSSFSKTGIFDEELERKQDNHFVILFLRHYKLAFVNKVLVKINGHNYPLALTAERALLMYFKKISQDLSKLNYKDLNCFYDLQYRMLAQNYSLEGNLPKTFYYIKESMKYRIHIPTKYLRIILKSIDVNRGWNLSKYILFIDDIFSRHS
jgi:glycosyltransferase involved in cell wall biosynthesis